MAVKVPPLLHKMSMAAQKAWYKKHGMEMPSSASAGKSAAQAKKDVGEINKEKAKVKSALQKALEASPKQKELKKSSERVRQMAANALAFGGQRPGGDLTTARGIVSYIRGGGYLKAGRLGEAAKPDASMAMTDTLKKQMISQKDKITLGKIADLMSAQKNKDKKNAFVRQLGLKAMKAGDVDPARGHSPTRFGREVLRKEEVEQIDEVTKKEAEQTLGGPVKEKPTMPPGKQPAGYRYVRGLARKAMKAGLKKEEVEQIHEDHEDEYAKHMDAHIDAANAGKWDKAEMHAKKAEAAAAKHFKATGEKIRDIGYTGDSPHIIAEAIKDAADVGEYDYEGDMAKSQLRSILTNAKRLHDMLEDTTNLPEWVQSKITLAEDYILTAANYMEGEMNEEVEQVDEVKAVKAYDKEGKLVGRYRSMDHAKQMKPGHTYKVEEEVVAEAEGKLAVTPKEKELAAHHGDPKKITYGDVIKARIKSAAEKAMKKGN